MKTKLKILTGAAVFVGGIVVGTASNLAGLDPAFGSAIAGIGGIVAGLILLPFITD